MQFACVAAARLVSKDQGDNLARWRNIDTEQAGVCSARRLGSTCIDPASTASDVHYTTCALFFVRQTPKPQLRMKPADGGACSSELQEERRDVRHCCGCRFCRAWFDPALRATRRRKLKVATASHSAVHSVAAWSATPCQSSNSFRLPWTRSSGLPPSHCRSGVWTPTSPPACDACHGHPLISLCCLPWLPVATVITSLIKTAATRHPSALYLLEMLAASGCKQLKCQRFFVLCYLSEKSPYVICE